jgi:hypothetical protein
MKKFILALALTGIMGSTVMAESNVFTDNGNKKSTKIYKANKKIKIAKKKKKSINKTTRKHKRSGHKFNA